MGGVVALCELGDSALFCYHPLALKKLTVADPERVSSIVLRQNYTMSTAFSSSNNERGGAFASGAFSSRAFASRAFGSSAAKGSARSSYNAERSGQRPMAYGGAGFGPRAAAKKEEPVVVATSFTDFPSLKKAAAAIPAPPPSKPVMNFKAVAAAAASKPAPPPPSLASAKARTEPGYPSYYQDEWPDYEDGEDVDLEITDEDGGLNSRRAGDKSNW